MYIWVVLATFMAILASYALSPRADIRQLTVEPLAEAQIARLVTKHKAAMEYVRYRKRPYTASATTVDYVAGVIADDILDDYIPHGHLNDSAYISQIFCMNSDMTAEVADCGALENTRLLVTYGKIPVRWVSKLSEDQEPTMDFMNAMRNTVDGGVFFGYTWKISDGGRINVDRNPSRSNILLFNRDNDDIFLPKAVLNNGDFAAECKPLAEPAERCLVYMAYI